MEKKRLVKISKFLSWVLRHSPEAIGLVLEDNGWVSIKELLTKADQQGMTITEAELHEVVTNNSKQRFAIDEAYEKIRANQGHSTPVALVFSEQIPPEYLYHGTVATALTGIQQEGLKKMDRHHVHLSKDVSTARQVGSRRGKAIILTIQSSEMANDGYLFYLSENGVWLTDIVPPQYISFP